MDYIVVSGPDASGKSTLASKLAEQLDVPDLPEKPFEIDAFVAWLNEPSARNLLRAQLAFLQDAFRRQSIASNFGGVVERMLADNYHVFSAVRIALGQLDFDAQRQLLAAYNQLVKSVPPPFVVIYLDADDDLLLSSMRSRHREDDNEMQLDVARELRFSYRKWANEFSACPLIRIGALSAPPADLALEAAEKLKYIGWKRAS